MHDYAQMRSKGVYADTTFVIPSWERFTGSTQRGKVAASFLHPTEW